MILPDFPLNQIIHHKTPLQSRLVDSMGPTEDSTVIVPMGWDPKTGHKRLKQSKEYTMLFKDNNNCSYDTHLSKYARINVNTKIKSDTLYAKMLLYNYAISNQMKLCYI